MFVHGCAKSCFRRRTNKCKTNTKKTIGRFCDFFHLRYLRQVHPPPPPTPLSFASQKLVLFLRRTTTTIVPHTQLCVCHLCVRACVNFLMRLLSPSPLSFASPSSLLPHFKSNEDWQRKKRELGSFSPTAFRRRKEEWMIVGVCSRSRSSFDKANKKSRSLSQNRDRDWRLVRVKRASKKVGSSWKKQQNRDKKERRSKLS